MTTPTLRLGSTGPDVAELHRLLAAAAHTREPASVDSAEQERAAFGPTTAMAVEDWQTDHCGPDGHALAVDGIVGPRTWWSLRHPAAICTRVVSPGYRAPGWQFPSHEDCGPDVFELLSMAASWIGRHEEPDGSNDGPELAGLHTEGRPWCALAVSHWLWWSPQGSPWGIRAGAWSIYDWARASQLLVTEPRPGDVLVLLREGGHGHVGLVAMPLEGGQVATVEGNSSNAVRGLVRPVEGLQFVRPWGELVGEEQTK